MHLWRKLATDEWLSRNEEELTRGRRDRFAVISRPGKQRLEIECCCATAAQAETLVGTFGGTNRRLPRNWQQALTKSLERAPLRIGRSLAIVEDTARAKSLKPTARRRRILVIPAGLAFGTGDHATTAMCLRLLERRSRHLPDGWTMLDVGTGTGVIVLAARCFGASKASGFDNDKRAVATAKSNAQINAVEDVRFFRADVLTWADNARYDVVAANLFSELLIAALPKLRRRLKPGGQLILSGILRAQENDVTRALSLIGFSTPEIRRRGKWIALVAEQQRRGSFRQKAS
jgi:ribosomal protein L11 methyltransferase